jgi:hypothetical protein
MIRVIPWSKDAEDSLNSVVGLDVCDVRFDVESGAAQLWECRDGEYGGYVVTRVEKRTSGLEWVWLACAGKGFHKFLPFFMRAAESYSLPVRVHVNNDIMARIYRRKKFRVSETVLRYP